MGISNLVWWQYWGFKYFNMLYTYFMIYLVFEYVHFRIITLITIKINATIVAFCFLESMLFQKMGFMRSQDLFFREIYFWNKWHVFVEIWIFAHFKDEKNVDNFLACLGQNGPDRLQATLREALIYKVCFIRNTILRSRDGSNRDADILESWEGFSRKLRYLKK